MLLTLISWFLTQWWKKDLCYHHFTCHECIIGDWELQILILLIILWLKIYVWNVNQTFKTFSLCLEHDKHWSPKQQYTVEQEIYTEILLSRQAEWSSRLLRKLRWFKNHTFGSGKQASLFIVQLRWEKNKPAFCEL